MDSWEYLLPEVSLFKSITRSLFATRLTMQLLVAGSHHKQVRRQTCSTSFRAFGTTSSQLTLERKCRQAIGKA